VWGFQKKKNFKISGVLAEESSLSRTRRFFGFLKNFNWKIIKNISEIKSVNIIKEVMI
jgi:hypothetical protein